MNIGGNFFEQLSISGKQYGGSSLEEWIAALDYRHPLDAALYPSALDALAQALTRHTKLNAERITTLVGNPNPLSLARLRGNHVATTLLAIAVIATSKAPESDRIWSLTYMLNDGRHFTRRAAACGLCHIGSAPALIAVLDAAPYASGVCRQALAIIAEKNPLPELAPALSRFIRREEVYFKESWLAVRTLADMGAVVVPQVREILEDPSIDAVANGLYAAASLGTLAAPLAEMVRALLNHSDETIRQSAANALEQISGPAEN